MLATFAPKLEDGVAGSGMHVHLKLIKDGKNVTVDKNENLSEESKKVIGGLCQYADVLTAFGNTVASSYLRLVPNQEAPTQICWSDSNRSVMIRVPLGWARIKNLAAIVNKRKKIEPLEIDSMQTFELRTGDGSAQVHLFLAGIALAAEWGMTHKEALQMAEKLYVKGNIFKNKELAKDLAHLPASCAESSDILQSKRNYFERDNIFPESVINYIIHSLQSENDRELQRNLS
jgi:glutamine synthetase